MVNKNDSPIYLSKLECPVCGAQNEIETLKVGAYNEQGRDTDFCPKKRTWNNPNYQKYNPLLFFMATCSNCFYTREFTSKYKDWKKDTAFRNYKLKTIKEKHLLDLKEPDSIMRLLGTHLDGEKYPFATAVNKLLLGIYDEKLNLKFSALDLGRYFLRIAWLFREANKDGQSEGGQLARHAMNIEDHILRLGHQYEQLSRNVEVLHDAANDFLSDALFPSGKRKKQLTEVYSNAFDSFDEILNKFKENVVNLKSSLSLSTGVMGEDASSSSPLDQPIGKYDSHRMFLLELKQKWDEVPSSELDAMSYAIRYYKQAYEEGNEISPGNQAIQAVYLIAELSRRVGKNEEAKGYFNTSIKLAQEYIHQNKGDKSRTALARKVLELALEQGKLNLKSVEKSADEPA